MIIEAIQVIPENRDAIREIPEYGLTLIRYKPRKFREDGSLFMVTEMRKEIKPEYRSLGCSLCPIINGDWLVRSKDDDLELMSDSDFRKTYHVVDQNLERQR